MATFVRNRVLNQLSWSSEDDSSRAARREALCELDGLLTQLEEINLRGGVIPTRVLVALRRRGVAFRARVSAAVTTVLPTSVSVPTTPSRPFTGAPWMNWRIHGSLKAWAPPRV